MWLTVKAGDKEGWTLDEDLRVYDDNAFSPMTFDRPASFDMTTTIRGIDIDPPAPGLTGGPPDPPPGRRAK